jgi:hypothetical protein
MLWALCVVGYPPKGFTRHAKRPEKENNQKLQQRAKMKRSVLCIAALLFLGLTAVRASDEVDESDVVVLNAQTFDAKTADGVWMVELYVTSSHFSFPPLFLQLCRLSATPLGAATVRHSRYTVFFSTCPCRSSDYHPLLGTPAHVGSVRNG